MRWQKIVAGGFAVVGVLVISVVVGGYFFLQSDSFRNLALRTIDVYKRQVSRDIISRPLSPDPGDHQHYSGPETDAHTKRQSQADRFVATGAAGDEVTRRRRIVEGRGAEEHYALGTIRWLTKRSLAG